MPRHITIFLSGTLALAISYASALDFRHIVPTTGRPKLFGGVSGQRALEISHIDVGNHQNIRYSVNVTLGGKDYVVALDTGSTDLWVHPSDTDSGNYNDTKIPLDLRYGDGSYGVNGTIALAPLQMGTYNVTQQAFLRVEFGTIQSLAGLGIDGLLGLSFDFPSASPVNQAVQARYGANTTWGSSALKNIFSENPEQPQFIALDLSRTDDLEDTAGGSFAIGNYAKEWEAVSNGTKLPQYPAGGNRWTALLEGIVVGGTHLNLTSQIRGVPSGQLVTLLDTGDPTGALPTKIQNDLYSLIPGAVTFTQDSNQIWLLPCNTTTIVEFTFGGQRFPVHPLDLSVLSQPISASGNQYTACIASIQGVDDVGGNAFEVSLGDVFLRNVYSVFNFDNIELQESAGNPYMQLLSQTDPVNATSQVAIIRDKTMATLPPEIPPAQLLKLLKVDDPTMYQDVPRLRSISIRTAGERSVLSSGKCDPPGIVVGLLAGNMAIGLVLSVLAILNHVRIGALARRPTRSGPHYVSVKSHAQEGKSCVGRQSEELSLRGGSSLNV